MQHNHQNIANMAIQIEGTNLARNEKTNATEYLRDWKQKQTESKVYVPWVKKRMSHV